MVGLHPWGAHPAHVLVDEEDRVTGVLDWTTARVGDPGRDFALHHLIAGPEAFDRTVTTYVEAPRTGCGSSRSSSRAATSCASGRRSTRCPRRSRGVASAAQQGNGDRDVR
ncbi:phosphotransferase [Georgenia wangjunii]|uniref:phosphotransferase n=1 Tax=Georgenia wangjunii TaxID=3117730 RepID=UPI003D9C0D9F